MSVTVLVYVALFNVIVTACPFSTPVVVIETVPTLLSSVAFREGAQEKALVAIALIDGAVVSTVTDQLPLVTATPALPVRSEKLML